jgi:hypothetical protein
MGAALNQRFRRLTDLFVRGKAVPMPDGTHLWIQVINSFERNEAISDAQVARARIVLALRQDGRERIKVEGRLAEIGKDMMATDLAQAKAELKTPDFAEEMRVDPEWSERMEIVMRTDWDTAAMPATEQEQLLMDKVNAEVLAEFAKREADEAAFLQRSYDRMTDDEFVDVWVEEWLDRRGSDLATAEFRLTELWYATRYCDAVDNGAGVLDHTRCEGHRVPVFESKTDARSAPQELQDLLRSALDELNLAGRDPKDSDSPQSSSDSPPPPSAEAASSPSTSTATPTTVPGT